MKTYTEDRIKEIEKELKELKEEGNRLEAISALLKHAKEMVKEDSVIECVKRGDDISLSFQTTSGLKFSLKIDKE